MFSTSILTKLLCLALSFSHPNWNYLAEATHSHMHVHYLQRTHTLQQQQYNEGGGGTHVHRMSAHSGYRLWYCRQHCSTRSSLFSVFRPSGDKEIQTERLNDRSDRKERDIPLKRIGVCLIHDTKSTW